MRVLYLEWMVSGEVIFHSLQTEKKKKVQACVLVSL